MNEKRIFPRNENRKIYSGKLAYTSIHERIFAKSMRITCELNGLYHTPEEVRLIFSRLTGKKVDDSFMLFPPFYSDYGQNITIGKMYLSTRVAVFKTKAALK